MRSGDGYRVQSGEGLDATRLNGQVVADRTPLPLGPGDVLHVGPHALEAGTAGENAAAPLASSTGGGTAARRKTDPEAESTRGADVWAPVSVVEVLADALAEALQVPRQFRQEFVGHPVSHPSDAQFLYEGEGSVIRQHLLDPALTGPERNRRLRYVREAAEALVLHQIAVLEGYKASVQAGLDELRRRVDPAVHRAAVREEHVAVEALPVLAEPVVLMRVRDECQALQREDWAAAEQRIFRPAFTKAYLEQMEVPHNGDARDRGQQPDDASHPA
jgi:hypothetical protein